MLYSGGYVGLWLGEISLGLYLGFSGRYFSAAPYCFGEATAIAPYRHPQVLIAEVGGVLPLFENYGPGEKFSLELRAALQQGIMLDGIRALTLGFGFGVGLLRTPATPLFRAFFNVGYSSEHPHVDDDGDGAWAGESAGKPRASRIARITSRSMIVAIIRMGPEHLGQTKTSTSKARFINYG